jgi:hypothetical protein
LPKLDRPIKPRPSSSTFPIELLLLFDVVDCNAIAFERVANVYNSSGHVKSLLRVSNKMSIFCSKPAS